VVVGAAVVVAWAVVVGTAVVVGAAVVVGVAVVVGATVVVGVAVVVVATVVVGVAVVVGAVVVGAGVVESDPPPQADAVNRTATNTGTSLMIPVCHLLLEDSEVRYEHQG